MNTYQEKAARLAIERQERKDRNIKRAAVFGLIAGGVFMLIYFLAIFG